MPTAEGLAAPFQHLAQQRLRGGEVALGTQQVAEVVDGGERVQVPVPKGLAVPLQHLAEQRLSLVVLALGQQLRSERVQGETCVLPIRALGLEPCPQKLEAQCIAVLVLALAAAVGCVLPWARAPQFLEAGYVDELGGAGRRLRPPSTDGTCPPPPPSKSSNRSLENQPTGRANFTQLGS